MKPFLQQVAHIFVHGNTELHDYCFVLPNRRSCSFFRKYLQEGVRGKTCVMPEITTISDFVADIAKTTEASRIELLFILYSVYKELSADIPNLDQFLYWGDMVISDFNDIDRYMVNAKEIFANVKNYKELNANYLTKEQLEVIRDFWGDVRGKDFKTDSLWNKQSEDSDAKKNFLKLWAILYPLYNRFRQVLAENGLAYSGMAYRMAVDCIERRNIDEFNFSKVVFVGFSTLSVAEERIFEHFKRLGIADFYWDYESPVFEDEANKGSFFLRKYIKAFPSCRKLSDGIPGHMPRIKIISVPSGGGQAKIAGQIINKLVSDGTINGSNAIDTAIVLPEEKYMNFLLFSMPEEIQALNITMGYPMKYTSIASLMGILAAMHGKKRIQNGEVSYYYEDLNALFAHPFVKRLCNLNAMQKLQKEIVGKHLFFVSESLIKGLLPDIKDFFDIRHDASTDVVIEYIDNLLQHLLCCLPLANEQSQSKMELYSIQQYRMSLMQIGDTIRRYGSHIHEQRTLFYLLERMLSGVAIPFEGEPLKGLQVMGVLETRLLDFKNLIVLSMNEKIYPSKNYAHSFIPNSIRTGFGIPTYELQDSMFTYYFYRMISRAENVYLLYDSRVQGISSGEESRYIHQLQKLYSRGQCEMDVYEYHIHLPEEKRFEVIKNDRIMQKINAYTQKDSGKNFSASMINKYLDCPLQFYFGQIEGLQEEDAMSDFIDSATFGTVVHDILQRVYDKISLSKEGRATVSNEDLASVLKSKELERMATISINKHYNKTEIENDKSKLVGEAALIGRIALYYVKYVLKFDMKFAPFEYIKSEAVSLFQWDLGDDVIVNYKQKIDRIDRIDADGHKLLRIVDYKTGNDAMDFNILEDLFAKPSKSNPRRKAILQLLLYCNAYAYENEFRQPILPVIYSIRNIRKQMKTGMDLKCGGKIVADYRDINEGFMDRIKNIIVEILNPEIPFRQTDDQQICTRCPYREACGKE